MVMLHWPQKHCTLMTSRKFSPRCDSDKQTHSLGDFFEINMWNKAPVNSSVRYSAINFAISMAPLGQNVKEGQIQCMMGVSCMKAVYEYTHLPL